MLEVCTLLRLLLVMPATNKVSERIASALQRVKTYLRTTMNQARLNSSMTLHIHKDKTDNLLFKWLWLAMSTGLHCLENSENTAVYISLCVVFVLYGVYNWNCWQFLVVKSVAVSDWNLEAVLPQLNHCRRGGTCIRALTIFSVHGSLTIQILLPMALGIVTLAGLQYLGSSFSAARSVSFATSRWWRKFKIADSAYTVPFPDFLGQGLASGGSRILKRGVPVRD